LTRESSSNKFPSEVKIAKVDYTNLESLTAALEGQDALVSAVASLAVPSQRLLIDAAVQAGVKRIIPSEYAYSWIISLGFYVWRIAPHLDFLSPPNVS
jgi:uncharacterized protein YbjT (DUF2867 family)